MTPEELDAIAALLDDLPLMDVHRSAVDRLINEVKRLQVEVDEVHEDRLRVMAERDALRAALQKCVIAGSPVPAKPPDTVAVPRELVLRVVAILEDGNEAPHDSIVALRALLEATK